MSKETLLKNVAETAYNVGFGAKKHFATYDIILKAPGLISFTSFAFGVFALIFEDLNIKALSATFLILGISGLYITPYASRRQEYADNGKSLTDLYNDLKRLYYAVKSADAVTQEHRNELQQIDKAYTEISCPHQMIFSNWYAHYKFFWEQQIGWVDEQLNFKFMRDKVPLSLSATVTALTVALVFYLAPISKAACGYLYP
ncbi:SLATT domain-containing protein [Alcanivorax sp. S6407]|uniref:SLATT domain-containing protein n=1 Tax=Alcanivorax sp. S6407 TaxID=2926424 RepID=UPI001FF5349A|nr:SLATT domain-containing protein [Alcanivorax sp. S6407]MCK0152074.1 SLATT domain-containing protein [Alcanivorax sp. S6407]